MDQKQEDRNDRKQQPAHSIKHSLLGSVIECAIWENETQDDNKVFFNMTFNRRYHDGNQFVNTKSMRVSDLPALAIIANDAYRWCQEKTAQSK